MIYPARMHGAKCHINNDIGVQLITTKKGTLAELWHFGKGRPLKNGRLFLITEDGKLKLFMNTNKIRVKHMGNMGVMLVEGE
jgi:hypothetical protein